MISAPLAGRRVLVTRAAEDARVWADRIAGLGAEAVILPCIHTEVLDDATTRSALAAALSDADWLCLTSQRGAEAVASLLGGLPPSLRIAAVGDATASAVRTLFRRTSFVSSGATSRALGEELYEQELASAQPDVRVVIAAALGGRTAAEDVLARAGVVVTRIDVYRTVPALPNAARIDLGAEQIADVLLASPSAVEGLLNQASLPASVRLFTIGPTTSAAVVAAGLSVAGEAIYPNLDSLVEAMQ